MDRFKSRARSLRANQTPSEAVLWKALRGRQLGRWKFRRQHPIGRYIVDFATLDGKLVVEVDGATHSTDEERICDEARKCEIERRGFHVIRFTNSDVRDNLDDVLATILHELEGL